MKFTRPTGLALLSAIVCMTAANAIAQESPVPPAVPFTDSETVADTIYQADRVADRLDQLEAENRQLMERLNSLQFGNGGSSTFVQNRFTQKFLNSPKRAGVFGGADYLRWTYRQPGLEYGITDIGGVQDRGAVGSILSLDSEYQNGVRAMLGYRFDVGCDKCLFNRPELLFTYTNFESELTETRAGALRATFITSDNSENDDSDNINTLGVETITPDDRATGVTARSDFQYNVYDIDFAQSLQLTETLTLRLSTGARIATVDDYFQVTYTGGDFQTAYTSFRDWDYNGGGITAGGNLDWALTDRFAVNVGAKTGLVMGEHNSRFFFPDDEPGVPTDVRHSETRVNPFVEMSAGFSYERPIGSTLLTLGAGYEIVNWFNMADNRTFTDSHMEGMNVNTVRDLTLDGFYARAALNY